MTTQNSIFHYLDIVRCCLKLRISETTWRWSYRCCTAKTSW